MIFFNQSVHYEETSAVCQFSSCKPVKRTRNTSDQPKAGRWLFDDADAESAGRTSTKTRNTAKHRHRAKGQTRNLDGQPESSCKGCPTVNHSPALCTPTCTHMEWNGGFRLRSGENHHQRTAAETLDTATGSPVFRRTHTQLRENMRSIHTRPTDETKPSNPPWDHCSITGVDAHTEAQAETQAYLLSTFVKRVEG